MNGATPRIEQDADLRRVLIARSLRAFGDGYVAILLPLYLLRLGFEPYAVGAITTATLLGSALLTLLLGHCSHWMRLWGLSPAGRRASENPRVSSIITLPIAARADRTKRPIFSVASSRRPRCTTQRRGRRPKWRRCLPRGSQDLREPIAGKSPTGQGQERRWYPRDRE
jgi:hypothetical protein